MRYQKINSNFFIFNRKRLIEMVKPDSLLVVAASDQFPRNGEHFFPYRQDSDFFYLTGIEQEKCILCLCPNHPVETYREILFTVKTDEQTMIWEGPKLTKSDILEISGISNVQNSEDFEIIFKDLILRVTNVYFALNENLKFFSEVAYFCLRLAKETINKYPLHRYERLSPLLQKMRLVKQADEISLIAEACEITRKAFLKVLEVVKQGVMEYQIEAEITAEYIRNGATVHAFSPIVATGINATYLHYDKNDKQCKDGDLLLLDFGAEYANYASDCSRTIPVNGKFTERQKEIYNSVLRVHNQMIQKMIPGTTIDELNKKANKLMEDEMIQLRLFSSEDVENQDKSKPLFAKYFMHGLSHFIGLDVHDVGNKQIVLEKGMVLSCEPGIYIREENIGIRIENVVVVDENPVNLTAKIPVEIEDIEHLMSKSRNNSFC